MIEFHDAELEELQRRIAARLGFRLVDHRMELYAVALPAAEAEGDGGVVRPPPAR